MGWVLLAFLSVVVFCLSARGMILAVQQPIDLVRAHEYSRRALRVERNYKIMAWSILTAFLFYSMVVSVWQSFSEIIF